MLPESLAVTLQVTQLLERLGVRYAIGGSLASSAHGVLRQTLDSDIVAELFPEHVDPLIQALGADFYADADMLREAIARRTSANLIHLKSMFKVDVFVAQERVLDRAELARRVQQQVSTEPAQFAYFLSPEDTILAKLDWYRQGGEVSERQWRDVLGLLAVQAGMLDLDYLERMAAQVGVADLLMRSRST